MCEIMEKKGVSRAELAKRMGVTKSSVSQLLAGTTNMQLRTISDVFVVLGHEFHPSASPFEQSDPGAMSFDFENDEVINAPTDAIVETTPTCFDLLSSS